MKIFNKYFPFLLGITFILIKVQDLSLPYFWDEAWSYLPALKVMSATGPSLMPGAIDTELYRGHPLLFYFLASTWMNIVPGALVWAKLFPLIISIALLFAIYSLATEHFNLGTANLSIWLLSIQSVFIAQASFLLPEMLLSFFTVQSIRAFLNHSKWQTILWVSLALYTKESALVLGLSLICWQLVNQFYKANKKINLQVFLHSAYLLLPFLFISLFFILQKIWVGWAFFPEHIGYISLEAFADKAEGYLSYLFIFRGRNLLSFAAIAALLFLVFQKNSQLSTHSNKIYGIVFFILSYLAFSSLNFYSPRYLLSVLPLILLLFSLLIQTAFSSKFLLHVMVLAVVSINLIYFSFFRLEPNDHTLGYRPMIKVHQEMCALIEKEVKIETQIATHFLMKANLENPDIGYLKNEKPYTQVSTKASKNTQIVIISNIEQDAALMTFLQDHNKRLVKRFSYENCWAECYLILPPENY
jgi:hypothetical protein